MAHGDAVINGDGVEFGSKTTGLFYQFFEMLPYLMQMDMTGNKLGERVDDTDDRLAELLFFDAVGSPEAARAGHSSACGGSITA